MNYIFLKLKLLTFWFHLVYFICQIIENIIGNLWITAFIWEHAHCVFATSSKCVILYWDITGAIHSSFIFRCLHLNFLTHLIHLRFQYLNSHMLIPFNFLIFIFDLFEPWYLILQTSRFRMNSVLKSLPIEILHLVCIHGLIYTFGILLQHLIIIQLFFEFLFFCCDLILYLLYICIVMYFI